jgi:hypothetical protein
MVERHVIVQKSIGVISLMDQYRSFRQWCHTLPSRQGELIKLQSCDSPLTVYVLIMVSKGFNAYLHNCTNAINLFLTFASFDILLSCTTSLNVHESFTSQYQILSLVRHLFDMNFFKLFGVEG